MRVKFIIIVALLATFTMLASLNLAVSDNAQVVDLPVSMPPEEQTQNSTSNDQYDQNSWKLALSLSIGVLLFGLILIILEIYIMIRKDVGWDTTSVRLIGLTLVITAGAFLIPAGYSSQQVASLYGLLGTIVGYLLGKDGEK